MKRQINKELQKLKKTDKRKILLIRGARQIGKTYSIRKLGKEFDFFLEVNFEEEPDISSVFEKSLNPIGICEKLSIYYNIDIIPGKTLLFFDEIQSCLNAIRSLRFFHEKMPELHVVAAGSLIEFALSQIPSFGVGRIKSLFMYPMSFIEFLSASGEDRVVNLISSSSGPLDSVLHDKILEKLKIFQIIGGMPEVVNNYIDKKNLKRCQELIDVLITSLNDDFAKYNKKAPVILLKEVFHSIAMQAGMKFKYSNIESGENHKKCKLALDLLVQAGLAYKIFHTSARGVPLGAQINIKKFKVLMFDSGVYQRLQGLSLSDHIIADFQSIINKGNLAEIVAGLEIIRSWPSYSTPELYYWHRESRSSNAEIDYVISKNNTIIPIEVKAGTRGQMQSLHIFMKERNIKRGLRVSHENFADYEKISTLPLYAAGFIYNQFSI